MGPPETLVMEAGTATEAKLSALRGAGLLDAPAGPDLERWVVTLRRRVGAPLAALRLLGEGGRELRVVVQEDGPLSTDGTCLDLALLDPELAGPLEAADMDGEQSASCGYLVAPVRVDGEELGSLTLVDPGRRDWTSVDVQALEDAASAVSTEVALRLAKRDAGRAQQLVVSHATVHDLIARAAPLEEVLVAVTEGIERHDPSVLACVVLLDPASTTLHPGAGPSLPASYLSAIDGVVIGPNIGTCGTAAWSGELTVTEDIRTDPKWAPVRHVPAAAGLVSCWSMPIKAPDGEVLGTLAFYGRRPRRPLPEHLSLLRDWARVAGIAIERHRAIQRLVHDARHDGLTGLANRVATMEALQEALGRACPQSPVAVLFVDLDGLKRLNDSLGHDRADEMLREVSARLASTVPEGCLVGRFGGDEFVVVAEGLPGRAAAGALALELLEAIAKPLPGRDGLVVTASIGIALGVDATVDAGELLREADSAMYLAKRSGRDRCAFYEGGQRVRSGRRVVLQRELRGAETRGELLLAYEPVCELSSGAVLGVEVVPSWRSPSYGEVGADELWRIADDIGTVVPLGAWVLRESCEAIAALSERLGRALELGVDVWRRQLENPGFAQTVHQVLVHARLRPDQLLLELDEGGLARPSTVAMHAVQELAGLGVHLVLDHAGGGLCAAAALKQLPISGLKMDGALTEALHGDPRDEAMAAVLVTLANAFGFSVGADGIATAEQRACLERLGFQRGQGPALARPAELEALAERLGAAPGA